MLTYEPGESAAHRVDPRAKLAFQGGFAAAAFGHTTLAGLVGLALVTAGVLAASRLRVRTVVREFKGVVPFLLAAPLLEAAALGPPWVEPSAAVEPALASVRTVLLLAVGAAYVKTTPVRESRAAIQWLLPGRVGQFLGMGVSFVFRFLPVLQSDIARTREAVAARLGSERPVHERMRVVATAGLARAFERADGFALALRARCFAWNPTLPPLRFSRWDVLPLVSAVTLGFAGLF